LTIFMQYPVLPYLAARPLVEQVVDSLRERIVSASYQATGELPPQHDLCRELGVSRTVVREAMQRLQSQGLIELSQGRRPRIRPASHGAIADNLQVLMRRSAASLLHLAEVRLPLEAEIAGLS
jgi:DNA-binding FadR family transcriptional regulator